MQRVRKNTIARRIMALVLAMVMIVGIVFQYTDTVQAAITTVADKDTSMTYEDDNFLGHEYSTEFAGRIWTDKSVSTIDNSNNFTVKYSALATAKSVTGQTNAPLDVVFVIDTSGSMMYPMSDTDSTVRINATVDALNKSIKKVMDMNEHTRVAVVAFSENADVLLELGRYEKGSRTYTTGNGWNKESHTVNDYFSVQNSTMYKHVIPEGSTTQQTSYRNVTGGTNIQYGYYEGLNELATTGVTTTDINGTTINRVPALIFLSDGAPTFSSTSTSWWQPEENSGDGPGQNPSGDSYYIGNGMKALMTAAYMKEAVNRNYAEDISIYSVGMGISYLEDAEKNLAYVTLAPNKHWNDTNDVASDFRSAWTTYITNDGTPTVNVGARNNRGFSNDYYTITHPTGDAAQYDIDTNVDALKNLVAGYYDADDADTVTSVFDAIVSDIALSIPEVPTEVKTGETLAAGGFLTYKDPIGKYMEVKGTTMNFEFEGTTYKVSDSDKDGVFTFDGNPSVLGSDGTSYPLNHISIRLTKEDDGDQVLEVKIPAALIPLRVNDVQLNSAGQVTSHTHNEEVPCVLTYTVGLIDDVYDADTNSIRLIPGNAQGPWSEEKLAEYDTYIKEHTDEETGLVNFYSNLYTGTNTIVNNKTGVAHTVGNAIVTFEPAHTNSFYYIQERMYVFNDEAMTDLTTVETLDDNTTYYYKETYYHEDDVVPKAIKRTGAQLKAVDIAKDETTGQWYRVPGSVRKNKLQLFENTKADQELTNTAQDFYAFSYHGEGQEGHFDVHLGNNGVLKAKVTGNLEITKIVTADGGLTAPDTEFEFEVTFGASDSYNYKIVDASGTPVGINGTISSGDMIVLKNGQTAEIVNLPAEATYEIEEKNVPEGFTTTSTGETGTILSGKSVKAVFTNHYSAEPVVVNENDTTEDFGVKKTLSGRDWNDSDKYTFILESHDATTPMPDESTPVPNASSPTHYLKEVTITDNKEFAFGEITYKVPGTYTYTISERVSTPGIPGISYSGAMYTVEVVVKDNGEGELTKTVTMFKLRNDAGTTENVAGFTGTTAEFVNTFSADHEDWTPVGTKDYTDNSGTKLLTDGMFTFYMTPNEKTPNAPMPASAKKDDTTGKMVTTDVNIGTQIGYDSITFTKDYIVSSKPNEPTSYYYDFTEMIPDGAINKGDGTWTLDGMTYDGRTTTVEVKVYYNNDMEIVVEPVYPTVVNNIHYNRVVFFNVYTPDDVTLGADGVAPLKGTKTLTGREWKTGDAFTFVLSTNDKTTQDAIAAGTITGVTTSVTEDDQLDTTQLATATATTDAADFVFGNITFKRTGTYKFQITETAGSLGGVTYDGHTTDVKVEVTDNNGKLQAKVTYDNSTALTDADKAVSDKAAFTNTYDAVDSNAINITGTKTLYGRDMKAGEFFLNVEAKEGTPMGSSRPGNAVPAAANSVESAPVTLLNNIVYTAPGTYVYEIKEHIPSDEQKLGGITYDGTLYLVTVTVVDNQDGNLVATPVVQKSEDNGNTWTTVTEADIKFHNRYETTPTTYSPIHLWKRLEGKELNADMFEFKLEALQKVNEAFVTVDAVDGMDLPELRNIKNQATGEIVFGDIRFTKEGTYYVKITEVIPTPVNPGMTYSNNELIVQFDVKDNGYGKLDVTRGVVSGDIIFTNTYETEGKLEGATNLKVVKQFTGRENNAWLDTDTFKFVLEPSDLTTQKAVSDGIIDMNADAVGNPQSVMLNISNAEEATGKAFDDILFTQPGVYEFKLYEDVTDPIPGINYDTELRTITVTAVDNGDGTMNVTAVITGGAGWTFHNVYDEESTLIYGWDALQVTKEVVGREWKNNESFTFTLEAADEVTRQALLDGEVEYVQHDTQGNVSPLALPATITMTEQNQNTLSFSDILFHKAGTYKFKITENHPVEATEANAYTVNGLTYDTTSEVVTITVVDEQSILVPTITYDADSNASQEDYNADADQDAIHFVNTYDASGRTAFTIKKVLEGRQNNEWLDTDKFSFEVLIDDDATKAAVESGAIVFPSYEGGEIITLTVSKDAQTVNSPDIILNEVGSYEFTIREVTANPIPGIIYDSTPRDIIVNVSDDELDGSFEVEVVGGKVLTFTNKYDHGSAELSGHDDLLVNKNLTGRDDNAWLSTDVFKFMLTPAEGVTKQAVEAGNIEITRDTLNITASNKGHAHFGDIIFHKEGTFEFIVSEIPGASDNGITYDTATHKVVVNVTHDQKQGILIVERDTLESEELVFNNIYNPANVVINKTQAVGNNAPVSTELTVRENNEVTYYLQVVNNGAGTASHVVITDEVPDGLTLVSKEGDTYTIGADGKTLTWNVGQLLPGVNNSKTVTFTVLVPEVTSEEAGDDKYVSWLNQALVEYNDPGETPDDPKDTDESNEVEIKEGVPEVSIQKTQTTGGVTTGQDSLYVKAGDEITYTMTVTNSGTEAADGVVVSDTIPEGLVYVSGGTHANGTVTWNLGTLEVNGTRTVSFTVKVLGKAEGEESTISHWTNIATVDYTNDPEDPDDTKDTPSNPVTVYDSASDKLHGVKVLLGDGDIRDYAGKFKFVIEGLNGAPMPAVTEVTNDAGGVVEFGPIAFTHEGTYTYKITEKNNGISGVTYDDTVYYAVVTVEKVEETTTNTAVTGETTVTEVTVTEGTPETEQTTVTEEVPETEPATVAEESPVNEPVVVSEENTTQTIVRYEVQKPIKYYKDSVEGTAGASFTFENTYYDAHVEIVKTQAVNSTDIEDSTGSDTVLTVVENDKVTYFLTVSNTDKGTASNVVVTDKIPVGLTVVEGTISDSGTASSDGVITWNLGELAANESKTVHFTVLVPDVKEDTSWKNAATVTYTNPDTKPEEHTSEEVEIKEGTPEVDIEKLQSLNGGVLTNATMEVVKGDKVTYAITVTNRGTEAARNITISDEIPVGLTISSIENNGVEKDGTVTWIIPELAAMDAEGNPGTATVRFTVTVPSVKTDTVWTNIATVVYENDPEDPENPEPSDPVVVKEGVPEVVITKTQAVNNGNPTTDKLTVTKDDKVTYFIGVTNAGTGIAKDIVVEDEIPAGLQVIEGSISNNGKLADGTITWEIPELAGKDELGNPGTETLSFTVIIPSVEKDTAWENIATVVYENDPEDPEDPEPSNPVVVEEGVPVVKVTKEQAVNNGIATSEVIEVVEGNEITYYITVTNSGTGVAKDIVVEDKIPVGLQLITGSISNYGKLANGTITWTISELAGVDENGNPGTVTVSFTVIVPDVDKDTTWKNIATVDYSNDPSDPDNEKTPDSSNLVEAKEEAPVPTPVKPQKTPTNSINTGDQSPIVLYGLLVVISLAIIAGALVYRKKSK